MENQKVEEAKILLDKAYVIKSEIDKLYSKKAMLNVKLDTIYKGEIGAEMFEELVLIGRNKFDEKIAELENQYEAL